MNIYLMLGYAASFLSVDGSAMATDLPPSFTVEIEMQTSRRVVHPFHKHRSLSLYTCKPKIPYSALQAIMIISFSTLFQEFPTLFTLPKLASTSHFFVPKISWPPSSSFPSQQSIPKKPLASESPLASPLRRAAGVTTTITSTPIVLPRRGEETDPPQALDWKLRWRWWIRGLYGWWRILQILTEWVFSG